MASMDPDTLPISEPGSYSSVGVSENIGRKVTRKTTHFGNDLQDNTMIGQCASPASPKWDSAVRLAEALIRPEVG
jgi:hypothetical protein